MTFKRFDYFTGERVTGFLVVLFFSTFLLMRHSGSIAYTFLALFGIVEYIRSRPYSFDNEEKILFTVFATFFIVTCVSYFISGYSKENLKYVDLMLRFALFPPIYLLFRQKLHNTGYVWWSVILGAIACGLVAIYQVWFKSDVAHGLENPIMFGDHALLLAGISLFGNEYFKKNAKKWIFIPWVGFIFGFISSFLSGSRGGWIAIPLIALLLFWKYRSSVTKTRIIFSTLVIVLFFSAVYLIPQTNVAYRLQAAVTDIRLIREEGNYISSLGLRYQMWRTAIKVARTAPLFGVGFTGYRDTVKELVKNGESIDHPLIYGHPHNEYLFNLATRGILGLLSYLALLIVPVLFFIRKLKSNNDTARNLALAGLCVVGGYAIFTLSETFFFRRTGVNFYVLSIAVISALLSQKRTSE